MAAGTVLFQRRGSQVGSDNGESSSATDNSWDDKALIEAFDEAAHLAKCKIAERMVSRGEQPFENSTEPPEQSLENGVARSVSWKKSKKKHNRGKIRWEVGAPCRAVFSEDGCEYEAIIQSINQRTGTCVVKYIGYDNEEEVSTAVLQHSQGATARQYQIQQALENLESGNIAGSDAEDPEHNMDSFEDMSSSAGSWTKQPDFIPFSNRQESFVQQQFRRSQNRMNIPIPPPPPPHLTSQFPDEDSEALSAMLLSWYMSGFHTGYYQGLREAKKSRHKQSQSRIPQRKE